MAYDPLLRQMTRSSASGGGGPPSGPAGGDLSGTYPNPVVAQINGVPLGSTAASAGRLLVGSGTQWVSQSLSGDATLSSGGVLTLASVIVAGGPTGSATTVPVITYDAKGRLTAVSTATIVGPFPPSGTAGGDLSGSYPNPTVAQINGNPLGSTTPTLGNLLVASGTQWVSVPMSGDATIAATGALTLASIIVAGGPVGDSGHVPIITFDAKGRLTVVSSAAITGVSPSATSTTVTVDPADYTATFTVTDATVSTTSRVFAMVFNELEAIECSTFTRTGSFDLTLFAAQPELTGLLKGIYNVQYIVSG